MTTPSPADFDSARWRADRNAKLDEWIGDPHAVDCVKRLANISEVWDDHHDEDVPDREEMMQAWRDALFGLERNPFWIAHRALLTFHVEQLSLLWETANHLETHPEWMVRSRGFFCREAANLLVPAVVSLLHGYARALEVSIELWEFLPHEEPDQWEFRHEPRRRR